MALVRGQLAPIMAMQQRVHRRQRHRATQRFFEVMLDLTDHQDAAPSGLLEKWLERRLLLLQSEVLSAPTAARRNAPITDNLSLDESVALFADPADR